KQSYREKKAKVFETLSYFDCVNFARQCKAAALFFGGPDGRSLPALYRLWRIQCLRWRKHHRRVPFQQQ
ncbi:acetylxylan esterase, partial [Mesorhizobium sp. M2D.F.Ca.ET.140.01.1.1]|uniref:acetylxylan esterase n=1 Tax=Mesorhizobium sp. M2D.F.Ca.ET.140.01.1.1 TaxID=2496664 RepID=UPI001FE1A5EF